MVDYKKVEDKSKTGVIEPTLAVGDTSINRSNGQSRDEKKFQIFLAILSGNVAMKGLPWYTDASKCGPRVDEIMRAAENITNVLESKDAETK